MPADHSPDNAPDIAKGREHHHAGRLDEAKAVYERVLKDEPENHDVLHMLGVVASQQDRYDDALALVGQALSLEPGFALAHNTAGSVYQRLGRIDDAIQSFLAAIDNDPDYGNAHFNLGTMLLAKHQHDEAQQALARAVELEPDLAEAHLNLGIACKSLGRHDQAISALLRATELNPGFAPAHSSLGNVYRATGDLEKAEAAHLKAVAADPDSHLAHFNLGNAAGMLGKLDESIAAYRRALEIKSDFTDARSNLATAFYEAGDHEQAVAAYRKAIETDPKRADLYWAFGLALLEMEDLEAALETVNAGLGIEAGNTKVLSLKAAVLAALGEHEAARTLVDFDRFIEPTAFDRAPGFANIEAFNLALRGHIESHPTLFGDPTHHATRNGKHTGELLQEPKGPVAALEEMIMKAGEAYRRKMGTDAGHPFLSNPPGRFRLTVWAILLQAQGYQIAHIHPGAWLSGVYYAQVPSVVETESEKHAGWIAFGRTESILDGEPGPEVHFIQPKEGMMVLFPSYFYHSTIPFETDETRISIAFDLMAD